MIYLIVVFLIQFNCQRIESRDQTLFYKKLNENVNFYCETGYIEVEDVTHSENKLFYHLFLKQGVESLEQVKKDDTFLLWIPGGPGSAATKYAFKYTGPFKVTEGKLILWDYLINEHSHVLYIDMPFGSGFSYSTKKYVVNTTEEAADYILQFIEIFLDSHKIFKQINFHVVGISYAGHFVPRIATKIANSNLELNFRGVFIGGSWTEALSQYRNQATTLISYGLIDQYRFEFIRKIEAIQQNLMMEEKYYEAATSTIDITFDLDFLEYFDPDNVYKHTNDPNDNSYIQFVIGNKQQYGIPSNIAFNPSNFTILQAFYADTYMSYLSDIEQLLQKGKVMLYNGQFDYNISPAGVQVMINNIRSEVVQQWKKEHKNPFFYKQKQTQELLIGGTVKYYKNFAFAIVYQAGHLTQLDQPGSAYQLLKYYLDF
ncbi:unnamed protein product (macronuclear) [Paramecium tetraurelia]|uniref:Serine carboxypeptidase n=1 Tax=Paramecium tetraurelia TaxID=5888 RepID=A0BEM3_PARTE|nr:uncharacterized protein GSPATT00028023001 [Paramecium tetraurelia]CAK56990.1 unnamed protein product [Paramecium tetraurelia]|eukprot:XP_001424388.1 hypothetical protein (macronuclear) [Paramecium tetraurelia strain d4-2]